MKNSTQKITPLLIALFMTLVSLNLSAQNNSLDLDGSNDYVEVPYNPIFTTSPITSIEAWAKPAVGGTGNYQSVLTSRGSFTGFSVYISPAGNWELWAGNGTTWVQLDGPAVDFGSWTHVAGTYSGTMLRFYVNGVKVDSLATTQIVPNSTSPTRIGAGSTESTPQYYFKGQIDEVRLWSTTRTVAQINANMNNSLAGTATGLLANYNFNEGVPNGPNPTITTLTDNTIHGITGNLSGFALDGTTSNWVSSDLVLPIHLLTFDGTKGEGANILKWSTSSEENSSYFEVQRSEDGTHFTPIAKVSAAGNSQTVKNYQYTDNQLSLSNVNYYRLNMVDLDGKSLLSRVIFFRNSTTGITTVYPNPARDQITINIDNKNLYNTQVILSDISGKVLQRITLNQSSTQVNISNYLKGMYILKFVDGKSIKIVKE